MIVQPHDHVLRYRVTSETQDGVEHVVDLGDFEGAGRCSCQQFEFRLLPEREAGRMTGRCKHLTAAREYLASEVIDRILEQGDSPAE